jgi:hypothetical protein
VGRHVVEARSDGGLYRFRGQVLIRVGGEHRLRAALRFVGGHLTLTSRPSAARVTVDGRDLGRTPLQRVPLAAGEHRLELSAPGHLTTTRQLLLEPGGHTTHELVLQPEVPLLPAAPAGAVQQVPAPAAPPPPGPKNSIALQAMAGPSWASYGDPGAEVGVAAQFGVAGGYLWRWRRLGLLADLSLLGAPAVDTSGGQRRTAWFLSVLAGAELRYYPWPVLWAGLRLGAGVTTLLGAEAGGYFLQDASEASGAFASVALRPALTVGWRAYKGLLLILTPIALDYSPRPADLSPNIKRLLRISVTAGVGWQI